MILLYNQSCFIPSHYWLSNVISCYRGVQKLQQNSAVLKTNTHCNLLELYLSIIAMLG